MKLTLIIIGLAAATVCFLLTRKKPLQQMDPKNISYSQTDITERFDDNLRLKPDEWIATTAINANIKDP